MVVYKTKEKAANTSAFNIKEQYPVAVVQKKWKHQIWI